MEKEPTMPAIFVNHGGGPLPITHPQDYTSMIQHLGRVGEAFPNPKGLIVVSAHWQEDSFTILDEDTPGLYYDFSGFSSQSDKFRYDFQSTSEIRQQVVDSLAKNGLHLEKVTKRGYDHGVFIPLMMMYPKSTIPVIQISLQRNLNPERHYNFGLALKDLRKDGFMIVCSGLSYHNMSGFNLPESEHKSIHFDEELVKLCTQKRTHEERLKVINNWMEIPFARECHPREEHLIPLFVCLGASDQKMGIRTRQKMMGVWVSDYVFE